MKNMIEIWCDGAARDNQSAELRRGSWGSMLVCKDLNLISFLSGVEKGATNNQMEATALLEALKRINNKSLPVRAFTDSNYIVTFVTTWRRTWALKGWNVKKANLALLKELSDEIDKFPFFSIQHVKGHDGILGNEIADTLCNAALDNVDPLDFPIVLRSYNYVQIGKDIDFTKKV